MIELIINKIKELTDALIKLDQKIGFRHIVNYVILIMVVFMIINIRAVSKAAVRWFVEIQNELHTSGMLQRDEYLRELGPLLIELRAEIGADRVIYFEYHNSEENLEGAPFKFFDMIKYSCKHGVKEISDNDYKDIRASLYTEVFDYIEKNSILVYNGNSDSLHTKFPGIYSLFNDADGCTKFIIVNLPGIKTSLGFIVLEWVDSDVNLSEVDQSTINEMVPRINAISVELNN